MTTSSEREAIEALAYIADGMKTIAMGLQLLVTALGEELDDDDFRKPDRDLVEDGDERH